ncbi:MAG: S-methyl-5-thioribose-1-phosphate isomerase [Pseudomonadota bacterium]
MSIPETLRFDAVSGLQLLDQRILPHEIAYLDITSLSQAWDAIKTLAVRGAPAIGVAAGYALAQSMRELEPDADFRTTLRANADYLCTARPTAVNLAWACERIVAIADKTPDAEALIAEAQAIHREDIDICTAIGEHGRDLITPGSSVLTHCNAGALAVSQLGTATAPMYAAHAAGVDFIVYVDETRPLYQGARLTAWELHSSGLDVKLICDNMAATVMAQGDVKLAMVGTDRVTANGDVVNKIGTLGVAILCQHYGIPFYVACPSSTFDPHTPTGADVTIEERASEEVRGAHGADVPVYNPAFDVTPAALVTAIITERGIFAPQEVAGALA